MAVSRPPTAFIPHGGGPWPVLPLGPIDAAETEALAGYMRSIAEVPAQPPSFLVVVSAHWEAPRFTVHLGSAPSMYFDYGGFPPEAYTFDWPAPGAPERGEQAIELLRGAGLRVDVEKERGFDHGTFIPLMLAYPQADVPVLQVSLKRGLDPAEHFALGQALAPLRDEGAYIIGSGNSYHNLGRLFRSDATARQHATQFDAWLNAAVTAAPAERARRLIAWERAPGARQSHPRQEHLIPLLVAAGAAESDPGRVRWQGSTNGYPVSAHDFG
ncbi:MAG: class III extradiol ring-cleavage dioxygenase [Myxococcota bacterium]